MKWRQLAGEGGERSFVLVFQTGDEAMAGLLEFAREQDISAARLTGLGAFSEVVLGYFDWERKDYERIPVREQVEALGLTGDIAVQDDEPAVHAHVVVGLRDGTTRGGHLIEARVRPTLEVMLVESPTQLRKRLDRESGLPLIDPEA